MVVLDLCLQQDLAINLGGVKPWCGKLTLLVNFPPGLARSCWPCLFLEGAGGVACQSSSSFISLGTAPASLPLDVGTSLERLPETGEVKKGSSLR